jgi:hypothetical protein
MKMYNKTLKAGDMLNKLRNHPALNSPFDSFASLFYFDIVEICKRGRVEGDICLWYNAENYIRFKKYFDDEFKEYTDDQLKIERYLIRINVPYEEYFGEIWEFNKTEYWGEISFLKFIGKIEEKNYSQDDWERHHGVEVFGDSFEDLIINLGNEFFNYFGYFEEDFFLTDEERENHHNILPFNLGSNNILNKDYIFVKDSDINSRWFKWFLGTDYGKKYYNNDIF